MLALCLRPLRSSVFHGNIGLSSNAYADDVLLVAQTRRGSLPNFTILANGLSKIGLSVNASKCEFICFNSPYAVAPFVPGTAVLPCSSLVSWLGLCFGPTLSTTCSSLVNQAVKNLRRLRENIPKQNPLQPQRFVHDLQRLLRPCAFIFIRHGSSVS